MCSKRKISVISILAVLLLAVPAVFAQGNADPGVLPNGDLNPGYTSVFSENNTMTLNLNRGPAGDVSIASGCQTVTLSSNVDILRGYVNQPYARTQATSAVRDNSSGTPCDISRVGARARLWEWGTWKGDTGMLNSYNSADQVSTTDGSNYAVGHCETFFPDDDGLLGRGNHEYVVGTTLYTHTTEKSC